MSAKFGMVGLGTMGRNFLLNVTDSGFIKKETVVKPSLKSIESRLV